jgi:hypothetical protein
MPVQPSHMLPSKVVFADDVPMFPTHGGQGVTTLPSVHALLCVAVYSKQLFPYTAIRLAQVHRRQTYCNTADCEVAGYMHLACV